MFAFARGSPATRPDHMKRLRQKAVRSLPWAVLESAGSAIFGFVSIFVLARVLGPEVFGAAAVVIALVTIVEIMISSLFVDALVQRRPLHIAHIDVAFVMVCAMSLLAATSIFAFAGPISMAYGDIGLKPLFQVATVSILFTGLSAVPGALLTRKMRMKQLAIRSLLGRLVSIAITLGCALNGYGAWSFVLGTVVGNGLVAGFLWTRMARKPRLRFSWPRLAELMRFGIFTGIEQSLWLATSRVFTVIVGLSHTHAEVGYLNLAMRLVETLQGLIGGVTARLALPLFSGLQHDRADLKRAFLTASRITACVSTPVFFGVAILADVFLEALFDPRWAPAAELVSLLSLAACGALLFAFFGTYVKAIGRPELNLFGATVTFSLATVGALLSSGHGVVIAASAYLLRLLFTVPFYLVLLSRIAGIRARDHFRIIGPSLMAASLASAVVWAVKLGSPIVLAPLVKLLMLGMLGGITFIGCMIFLDAGTLRQFLSIGKRATSR